MGLLLKVSGYSIPDISSNVDNYMIIFAKKNPLADFRKFVILAKNINFTNFKINVIIDKVYWSLAAIQFQGDPCALSHVTSNYYNYFTMNRISKIFFFYFFFPIILTNLYSSPTSMNDTVKVPIVFEAPLIDGIANDSIWDLSGWQYFDQYWLPWNEPIDSSDFYGRYKAVWHSANNLIYFLVEINDDVFVTGYQPNNSDYAGYDCVELFIDEDRSGGRHTSDHNAFALHITGGNKTSGYDAMDIDGGQIANLKNMIPELKIGKEENYYTWEFALQVHDDTYDKSSPAGSRVQLIGNKVMGFSFAYCENDDVNEFPNQERDNFIGTVMVTEENQNNHWMDASIFGIMKLMGPENNQGPKLINKHVDLYIEKLDAQYLVSNLSSSFVDPENTVLKYTVIPSDTTVYTEFVGSFLFLRFDSLFDGEAEIIIHATDGDKTASDTFLVQKKKAVNIEKESVELNVFPNPFQDQVTLIMKNNVDGEYQVSLIDFSGKCVFSKNIDFFENHFQALDLAGQLPGAYTLIVEGEHSRETIKLIKE